MKLVDEVKHIKALPRKEGDVELSILMRQFTQDSDVYKLLKDGYLEIASLLHDRPTFTLKNVVETYNGSPYNYKGILGKYVVTEMLTISRYGKASKLNHTLIRVLAPKLLGISRPEILMHIPYMFDNYSLGLLLPNDYKSLITLLMYNHEVITGNHLLYVILSKLKGMYKQRMNTNKFLDRDSVALIEDKFKNEIISLIGDMLGYNAHATFNNKWEIVLIKEDEGDEDENIEDLEKFKHYAELKYYTREIDDILFILLTFISELYDAKFLYNFIIELMKMGAYPLKFAMYALTNIKMWVKLINEAPIEHIKRIVYDNSVAYIDEDLENAIINRLK